MAMGFTIVPDGWDKRIDVTASSRILSSLGRNQIQGFNGTGDNVSMSVALERPSTGGTYLCIPNKGVYVEPSPSNGIPKVNILRSASVSGGTLNINAYQYYPNVPNTYDISSFEVPSAQPQTYGIAMSDSTNFTGITDVSRFGYVTYRAIISISGAWTLPASIPNRDSCVVFARWENGGTPLFYDRATYQIRPYTAFGSTDGAQIGGTVTNIYIVVVSTGVTPPVPASGFGTIIRNGQGVITFSSAWPPVIWRGGMFNFPYYLENSSGSPAKVQWNAATGNVALPMVPLGSYGFMCGDYSTVETYKKRPVCYSGLLMSGNSVSTYRAMPAGSRIAYDFAPIRGQIGLSVPCLDAADYF
ncbi:DUF6453 family protein [Pantoea agglomerans]|uniref:DUF6453 family protein n=1 Tax=Enterobacter agglomerans TaxID=549 RepID=UPI000AB5C257|nr:DUF6453 family protein [Pantoea agglomerans]WHU86722.1 DUF6453 family protein [Pantoea agglomerans pv. gypsophilae]